MNHWSGSTGSSTARSFTALLALATTPLPAWGQERGVEWGWGMHPMSWMWGAWGLGMMLLMLVFWAVVITGVVLAIRAVTGHGWRTGSDRALDILRERYARGEINKEEFDAKRRDLR